MGLSVCVCGSVYACVFEVFLNECVAVVFFAMMYYCSVYGGCIVFELQSSVEG